MKVTQMFFVDPVIIVFDPRAVRPLNRDGR